MDSHSMSKLHKNYWVASLIWSYWVASLSWSELGTAQPQLVVLFLAQFFRFAIIFICNLHYVSFIGNIYSCFHYLAKNNSVKMKKQA